MKLVYGACFYPFEGGDGYTVVVPDLPGCERGHAPADPHEDGVALPRPLRGHVRPRRRRLRRPDEIQRLSENRGSRQ